MLEGLDRVDWDRLEHAYGKATDVPGQLRALTSRRAKKRDKALYELHGNIWHQHTVYEATAHAVPFLAEVALADRVPQRTRASVVLLLAEIADGTSYVDVHAPLFEDMGVELEVEPGQLERELGWVRAAHDAVREQLPSLSAYLEAGDTDLRLASAYLVSKFPEDAAELSPRLRALHESEPDTQRRQVYALALATLEGADEEATQELVDLVEDVLS